MTEQETARQVKRPAVPAAPSSTPLDIPTTAFED